MSQIQITAYSDYVCPWCYIGLHRIERLQRELPVSVTWQPFELHPETPRTGADLRGRLGNAARVRAYVGNIINLARESGIDIRMPQVVSNSHFALEAAEFAREHGGFDAYHPALFRAYFEEGCDVGDVDVLCDVARACRVDDQRLRAALTHETYRERIDEITTAARSEGILSTPTFVYSGGFQLTGAQDYNVFASITGRLLARMGGDSTRAESTRGS